MSAVPPSGGRSYVSDQWIHRWGLTVYNLGGSQALVISMGDESAGAEQLRIRFNVRQADANATPNNAVIRVYNPAPNTVSQVKDEYTRVTLSAGYRTGRYATIFDGTIKFVVFGRESPVDTFLEIYASDGDRRNFALVNTTLMPGANSPQQQWEGPIQNSMQQQGIDPGVTQGVPAGAQWRPTVLYGNAQTEADVIARSYNMVWSVQNGKLTLIPSTQAVAGEEAKIDVLTGMVGFPRQVPDGVEVSTLLNPNLHIRQQVKIDNSSVVQTYVRGQGTSPNLQLVFPGPRDVQYMAALAADGQYVALVVEHEGDTRGDGEWRTNLVLVNLIALQKGGSQGGGQDQTFPASGF